MGTIIAAAIGAIASIIVCVINSNAQYKKMVAENKIQMEKIISEMDKHNEIQAIQIQELDKKVDKHNKVIERVYKLEQCDEVEKEQIKVINHRISDLEGYHK